MLKHSVMAVALASAFGMSFAAHAAGDKEMAQLREEIRQMKQDYEARIQALEKRLQAAEVQAQQEMAAPVAQAPVPAATAMNASANANAFNPEVSLILGGTYANLKQDPRQFRIQGFVPGGEEIGPGARSFNLGESELTLRANIDPQFAGQLTFALAPDNSVGVEEAFFRTRGLSNGLNLKGGRFLSAIGYLNGQHAHTWDFVDAPLAYQAFFGGQYKPDGVQLTWLAPTERFFEMGVEAGNGGAFPGGDRNKNGFGSSTLFAHVGDDIGDSASWRVGASLLHTGAADRIFSDSNAFSGHSNTWVVDAIYKWAPSGNATQTNFKLQGEYFRRRESGTLMQDQAAPGTYASAQSGWYLQGVYQFRPLWRVGLRYDKLYSGTPEFGAGLDSASFPLLSSYNPSRSTAMLDYSPSEFSRFRLQFARDKSRPDATDNQLFLQYIMSLGVHGAHTF